MNDDFLTVTEETARKIVASHAKELEDWASFLKTLYNDYKLAKKTCAVQPTVQFLRRIQIRNFCALVEAQTHVWKLLTIKFHRMLKAELNNGELSVLAEKGYELDEKGNLQERNLRLQTLKNFKFGANIFAKVFCCSKQINFNCDGWISIKEVFTVRDRLMHPQFARGVKVEDKEIVLLDKAENWFVSETKMLFDSQEDFLTIRKRKQSSERLN